MYDVKNAVKLTKLVRLTSTLTSQICYVELDALFRPNFDEFSRLKNFQPNTTFCKVVAQVSYCRSVFHPRSASCCYSSCYCHLFDHAKQLRVHP